MKLLRLMPVLLPAALLASCGDETQSDADARSSTGQVLEGTISDAMLPVDRVRSEPPLLRPAPSVNGATGAAAPSGDEGDENGESGGDEDAGNASGEADESPEPSPPENEGDA